MGPLTGTLLGGRYRLRRCIGEGGMGAVFEAYQEDLRRTVAVKVIGLKPDPSSVSRFQREARAAAALGHPHIVQIFDFQTPTDEPPFLVMELLPGASLADLLRREGVLRPERIARIAWQVLDALVAAHAAGVIHRDIKPANIFMVPSATLGEFAKVLDFGVAKLTDTTTASSSSHGLIGTLSYMAPEQASGEPIDGRADVYSLAATMYVACTLQKPFEGDTAASILRAMLTNQRRTLGQLRPDLDPSFVAIVERGMAHAREQRYASASAMAADLDAWLTGRVPQAAAMQLTAPTSPTRPATPVGMDAHAAPHGHVLAPATLTAPTTSQGLAHAADVNLSTRRDRSNAGLWALALAAAVFFVAAGGGAVFFAMSQNDKVAPGRAAQLDAGNTNEPARSMGGELGGGAGPSPSMASSVAPSGVGAAPKPSTTAPRPRPAATPGAATPSAATTTTTTPSQANPTPGLKPGTRFGMVCKSAADCDRVGDCVNGVCACASTGGLCNGECKLFLTEQNCGGCGIKCAPDEACMGVPQTHFSKWHCRR